MSCVLIPNVFWATDSSAWSSILLKFSIEFFRSLYFSVLGFLLIYFFFFFFLNDFTLFVELILFMYCFPNFVKYLSIHSYNSMNFFKRIVLSSLTFHRYSLLFVSCSICLILCNPMDCSPPSSTVHGILQARIL